MTGALTTTHLAELLGSGGDYAAVLQRILDEHDTARNEVAQTRSTIASRKAAFAEAVKNLDHETLDKVDALMRRYVLDHAAVAPQLDEPRQLTEAEARDLMAEYTDWQQLSEFLASRRDTIRELVFTSITEKHREAGQAVPEAHNGEIVVGDMAFKKEGAGYKAPSLDLDKLTKLLGDDADQVLTEELIPAKTVTKLDEEALMRLIAQRPEVMAMVAEATVPGAPKTAKFTVRPAKR